MSKVQSHQRVGQTARVDASRQPAVQKTQDPQGRQSAQVGQRPGQRVPCPFSLLVRTQIGAHVQDTQLRQARQFGGQFALQVVSGKLQFSDAAGLVQRNAAPSSEVGSVVAPAVVVEPVRPTGGIVQGDERGAVAVGGSGRGGKRGQRYAFGFLVIGNFIVQAAGSILGRHGHLERESAFHARKVGRGFYRVVSRRERLGEFGVEIDRRHDVIVLERCLARLSMSFQQVQVGVHFGRERYRDQRLGFQREGVEARAPVLGAVHYRGFIG